MVQKTTHTTLTSIQHTEFQGRTGLYKDTQATNLITLFFLVSVMVNLFVSTFPGLTSSGPRGIMLRASYKWETFLRSTIEQSPCMLTNHLLTNNFQGLLKHSVMCSTQRPFSTKLATVVGWRVDLVALEDSTVK